MKAAVPTYILGIDQAEHADGWGFLQRDGQGNVLVVDSGELQDADERATVVRWAFRIAQTISDRPLLIALEKHVHAPSKAGLCSLHAARGRWLQCIEEASKQYGLQYRLKYYMAQSWRRQVLGKGYPDDPKFAARTYVAELLGKDVDELGDDHAEGVCIALCCAQTTKDPRASKRRAA